jgi:hypothetical protein
MSVVMEVFIEDRKMVEPSEWARALVDHGFAVELDEDFDVRTHTGFLPCEYRGVEAGFEYACEELASADDLEEHVREAIATKT